MKAKLYLVDGRELDVLSLEEDSPTTYKIEVAGGETAMFYKYTYTILKDYVLAVEVEI